MYDRRMRALPRSRSSRLILALAVLLPCVACKPEISADLKIDGEPFQPTACRSGQIKNFSGVDLIDNAGRTLRLAQSLTNQPQAILIAGDQVIDLGPCGTMTVNRQNSTVNDVTNVEGQAILECEGSEHSVIGAVSFKNCH